MSTYIASLRRLEHIILSSLQSITIYNSLHTLILAFTHLGSVATQLLIIMLFCFDPTHQETGFMLALAHTTTTLIVQLIKLKTARLRPYQVFKNISNKGPDMKDYSFPSGHTNAAFTTAAVLSYFFPSASLLFFLLASTVGFSRMALGVHYPSDVLIGTIIGILVPSILLRLVFNSY